MANNLNISPGKMSVGGSAMLKYSSPEVSAWSWNYIHLGVDLNYSYFVLKDFALVTDLALSGRVTSGSDESRRYQWGVGLFYAFDTHSKLYPYVQALGFTAYQDSGWSLGLMPSIGLLIELSSQIALDVGINGKIDFAVPRGANTTLDFGVGYLGLKVFL
jgi:hypothetical protein